MSPILPHIKSKTIKTKILMKNRSLHKYVPDTHTFSYRNFFNMIKAYKVIYIKPDRGRYGKGVMRGQQVLNGNGKVEFNLQYKRRIHSFKSLKEMYAATRKVVRGRRYILQKGIPLLTYNNRPFDIRVMVQQAPAGRWETTGLLARIAGAGQIVTNFHSGGTPLEIDLVLSQYMSKKKVRMTKEELAEIGLKAAQHFHKYIPNLKEVGVDVALDPNLRAWILEVNTRPDAYIFKRLKNKSVFNKIFSYAQRYGKYKTKLR